MNRSTQIALCLLLAYPIWSIAVSPANQAVSLVCGNTHDPKLCTSTSVRYAGSYPVSSINAKAVLQMHLRATSKRASAAKGKVAQLSGKNPATSSPLRGCDGLYSNIIDLVGVSLRAIDANDGQTKQMVQISLMQIKQALQQCDYSFQKLGMNNPMGRFDASLLKMAVNCDDLNNIM